MLPAGENIPLERSAAHLPPPGGKGREKMLSTESFLNFSLILQYHCVILKTAYQRVCRFVRYFPVTEPFSCAECWKSAVSPGYIVRFGLV